MKIQCKDGTAACRVSSEYKYKVVATSYKGLCKYFKMMLFTSAFYLISLFAALGFSANGCRQCSGDVTLSLSAKEPTQYIEEFAEVAIGHCGGARTEYQVSNGRPLDCDPNHPALCSSVTFHLQAWRFCHNGGSAKFTKNYQVKFTNAIDTVNVLYDLICTHSVDCAGHGCAGC